MRKKDVTAILVILLLVVGIVAALNAQVLKRSCCSMDEDCCCPPSDFTGMYLDSYWCVCSGGYLVVNRCYYLYGRGSLDIIDPLDFPEE